ncbi:MAG: hypothetical protein KDE35_15880 [Geminicoccaceae bacterium]|nr:hypothetical protein [Geminicoccaceae bacterium]
MGLIERQAIDRAFRAGLLEVEQGTSGGLREDGSLGVGEMLVMGTRRMAGLDDADAAYETGRVLRHVARLFDKAGAPAVTAEQFRDNLAAAVMTHAMRRTGKSWRVDDSIAMFLEMYERILEPDPTDLAAIRSYLQRKAERRLQAREPPTAWKGLRSAA